ncbi:MAG: hypothetical protein JW828_06045 [Sedimentisphaerales bacterium]|nr:hypothetical protein [Sedimentisphaerales bacterium]
MPAISFRVLPLLIFVPAALVHSQDVPDPDAIIQMEQESIRITEQFLRDTLEIRLRYEFGDRFLGRQDRETMQTLARRCRERLQEIHHLQSAAKEFIEAYEGDDWDARFGDTGLWRKLHSDAGRTAWFLCQTNYWFALSADAAACQTELRNLLESCRQNAERFDPHQALLLTAQAQIQLARQDFGYLRQAEQTLLELLTRYAENRNLPDAAYFQAVMLRLKMDGKAPADQIVRIRSALSKTKWANDPELNIRLAFLELRSGEPSEQRVTEIVNRLPGIQPLIATTLLDDLTCRFQENTLTPSDLQPMASLSFGLALQQACRDEPEKHIGLLEHLSQLSSSPRPLLHFALAQAYRTANPEKAIAQYVLAATGQKQKADPQLDVPAVALAAAAARQAYQLYFTDESRAPLACQTLAFYYDLAEDRPDPKLEYAYATVLRACQKTESADTLLLKIADQSGPYAWQARLDRILCRLENQPLSETERELIQHKIHDLIVTVPTITDQDKQVRTQAIVLWCRLTLEKPTSQEAEKVLQLLDTVTDMDPATAAVLRSMALRTQKNDLNAYPKAAAAISSVLDSPDQNVLAEALAILTDTIERIDQFQAIKNYPSFVLRLRKLALYAIAELDAEQRSQMQLIMAELLTVLPEDKEALEQARSLLDYLHPGPNTQDFDWMRSKARLLTANKQFVEAAETWEILSQAAGGYRDKDPWSWWQARYYQIYCYSRISSTRPSEIYHAIDVLLNSTPDCPPFWKDRLNALQKSP